MEHRRRKNLGLRQGTRTQFQKGTKGRMLNHEFDLTWMSSSRVARLCNRALTSIVAVRAGTIHLL